MWIPVISVAKPQQPVEPGITWNNALNKTIWVSGFLNMNMLLPEM